VAPLREPSRWPLAVIQAGAVLFIFALVLSVLLDPAVWLLHGLQALIYVAVIVLARRDSAWGFGAGFTVAVLWNSANLFATGFIAAGVDALWAWLRTGHLARPVLLLILVGAAGHFLMILGCLVAFLRGNPKLRRWAEFVGGAALLVVALVLISPLRHHQLPLPLDIAGRYDAGSRRPSLAEGAAAGRAATCRIASWPRYWTAMAGRGPLFPASGLATATRPADDRGGAGYDAAPTSMTM
jgi:hypothetical protein